MSKPPTTAVSPTSWSLVLDRASQWKTRLEELFRLYWRSPFWYIIRSWKCSKEEAANYLEIFYKSLVHDDAIEMNPRDRGRFRTYVKIKLKDWVLMDVRKKESGTKAGNGSPFVVVAEADEEALWNSIPAEEEFDRLWARSLVSSALGELESSLKSEGKEKLYKAFWMCAIAHPRTTYKECAAAIATEENTVQNYVFRVRVDFTRLVHRRLLDTVEAERDASEEMAMFKQAFVP